jgi:hypothetical protein
MKFSTTTFLSLLSLAAAAPAPVPQIPSSGAVIAPSAVSQFDVWTGAIRYASGAGKIFKNGRTTDTTTLLTFTYPTASGGRTCTFHLYLDAASVQTGAKDVDIYSSLQPATTSTSTWGPGNQRNNQLARVAVSKPGDVTYLAGYPQVAKSYPCPSGTVGYELAPTDDTMDIEWTQSATVGAYITYA